MGIQGLAKLIGDNAPAGVKTQKFENYFGRKIAVDASMCIYQFLIVVGRQGDQLLSNEAGEITRWEFVHGSPLSDVLGIKAARAFHVEALNDVLCKSKAAAAYSVLFTRQKAVSKERRTQHACSHIQGMFYRTSRMLQAGIKPIYVFDGKPPKLKQDELDRRFGRRDDAQEELKKAHETGDSEAVERFSKRTVKVTKVHIEDCKRLLTLMGVPYVEAGTVYGVATDDMDALTFGTPKLIRHLMAPGNQQKLTIDEFDMATVLDQMGLTQEQFIDMCMLCGCDYCGTIRGIGPKKAYQLVSQHGALEKVVEALDKTKYVIPEPFPIQAVRDLFLSPEVLPSGDESASKPVWKAPDLDGLVAWLVHEKQFSEERVRSAVDKIVAARSKSTQNRLESFFKPVPGAPRAGKSELKRKEVPAKSKGTVAKKLGKK